MLSVVRLSDAESAPQFVNDQEFGNGTAIFTRDGGTLHAFANRVNARMGRHKRTNTRSHSTLPATGTNAVAVGLFGAGARYRMPGTRRCVNSCSAKGSAINILITSRKKAETACNGANGLCCKEKSCNYLRGAVMIRYGSSPLSPPFLFGVYPAS